MKFRVAAFAFLAWIAGITAVAEAGENAGAYMTFDLYRTMPGTAGDAGRSEIGEVGPNETIYMKIYIHNAKNLKAWEFRFTYNNLLVEPVAVKADSNFLPDIAAEKNILKKNHDFGLFIIPGTSEQPRIIYGGTISSQTDTAFAADGSGLAGVVAFKTKGNFAATSDAVFAFYRLLFVSITDPDDGGDVLTENLRTGHIKGDVVSGVEGMDPVPAQFALLQNYPNPFNPSTRIPFQLQKAGKTSLRIYNALGQQVGVLVNQALPAGNHEFIFSADGLASGMYFYILESNGFRETKKMIYVK